MGRSQRLEDRLAALADLRHDPTSPETLAALRKALTSKVNHIVARAAEIAGDFRLGELEPDLVSAFDRFMVNATKTDPGCAAKASIVEALYKMEAYQPDVYLQGIGHVQPEPVYGGKEDTAAKLRGVSALGLVRIGFPGVMLLLAQLLADPESDARIAAARAIGYSGLSAGVPLLRYKVLIGDAHPQVLIECFSALLQLEPEPSLSFIAGFLHRDGVDVAVQEAAAVALGESHLVKAFPFLETAWEDARDPELRQTLLLAIALLRHERALSFLLALLEKGGPSSERALAALGMYREDERIWERVEEILRKQECASSHLG
ncbi:MAG: HEAT repeat domain-containing protein [Anaerolineae bacterium]